MNNDTEVSQDIVDAIVYEYYKQTGYSKRPNSVLQAQARKAAPICERKRVDPANYVAAQIAGFEPKVDHKVFGATDLCTYKAEENVNNYMSRTSRGSTWQGAWNVEKRYLATAIKNTKRTLEEILLDKNLNFHAWFRCLISKEPIPSVIQKFGYQAWQELKDGELVQFLEHLKRTENVHLDTTRIPDYW